jgi:hypothetical protein
MECFIRVNGNAATNSQFYALYSTKHFVQEQSISMLENQILQVINACNELYQK